MRNGPNLSHTFILRRQAAKRTFPPDLTAEAKQLALLLSQHKRPRLEEPVTTSTDDATYANGSHDTTVALTPLDAAADHADSDNTRDGYTPVESEGYEGH
jgi:hypothetical protein